MELSRRAIVARLLLRAVAAAALGSVCGAVAYGLVDLGVGWSSPGRPSDTMVWLSVIALVAFPFALVAVLLAGLPLAIALRRLAASRWLGPLGAGIGGAAGLAMAGLFEPTALDPLHLVAALIGGFTGLFWAAYARAPILHWQGTRSDDTP